MCIYFLQYCLMMSHACYCFAHFSWIKVDRHTLEMITSRKVPWKRWLMIHQYRQVRGLNRQRSGLRCNSCRLILVLEFLQPCAIRFQKAVSPTQQISAEPQERLYTWHAICQPPSEWTLSEHRSKSRYFELEFGIKLFRTWKNTYTLTYDADYPFRLVKSGPELVSEIQQVYCSNPHKCRYSDNVHMVSIEMVFIGLPRFLRMWHCFFMFLSYCFMMFHV